MFDADACQPITIRFVSLALAHLIGVLRQSLLAMVLQTVQSQPFARAVLPLRLPGCVAGIAFALRVFAQGLQVSEIANRAEMRSRVQVLSRHVQSGACLSVIGLVARLQLPIGMCQLLSGSGQFGERAIDLPFLALQHCLQGILEASDIYILGGRGAGMAARGAWVLSARDHALLAVTDKEAAGAPRLGVRDETAAVGEGAEVGLGGGLWGATEEV